MAANRGSEQGGATEGRPRSNSPRRSEYLSSVPWGTGASPQFRLVLAVVLDWLPNRGNCKNFTEVVSFSLFRPEAHKLEEQLRPHPTKECAIRVALEFRHMLDERLVRNQAEIARLRGISRARVTQMVNIARLPQDTRLPVEPAGRTAGLLHQTAAASDRGPADGGSAGQGVRRSAAFGRGRRLVKVASHPPP